MKAVDCPPATLCVVEEDLEDLAPEWHNLLQEAGLTSPFLEPAWLQVWLAELAPGADLLLLGVRDGDRLLGLMPLLRQGEDLILAGDSEICDYSDAVSLPGHRGVVLEALFDHLQTDDLQRRSWRRLLLWGIRADSPTLSELPPLAERAGLALTVEPEAVCPRVMLPSSWEEYLLSLSKKDRHELRRKIRRLGETGTVTEYLLSSPEEIAAALPDFLRLHRTSRQDKAEFMTARMEQFFRSMTAALSAEDRVRLYFLELDGLRVATVLAFDAGDELWLYNSGFDPTYSSASVGLASKALALRMAIAEGKRCYDFLRGSEPYKYDLGATDLMVFRCVLTRQDVPDRGRSIQMTERVDGT